MKFRSIARSYVHLAHVAHRTHPVTLIADTGESVFMRLKEPCRQCTRQLLCGGGFADAPTRPQPGGRMYRSLWQVNANTPEGAQARKIYLNVKIPGSSTADVETCASGLWVAVVELPPPRPCTSVEKRSPHGRELATDQRSVVSKRYAYREGRYTVRVNGPGLGCTRHRKTVEMRSRLRAEPGNHGFREP